MDSKEANISVIMCTYNGAKFIREQLDSILNQTQPARELIVQDDCSTDDTFTIVSEYASRYPQIKALRNERQLGINENFFSAIRKAHGNYIAISDQDDIWCPDKLELQLKNIGDKLLCAGRSTPFSDNGAAIRIDERIPNFSLLRMLYVGCLSGHTLFFSKDLMSRLPDLSQICTVRCYDVILTMVAASFNSIIYINKTLVHQRRHIGAATYSKPLDNSFTLKNMFRTMFNTLSLYKEVKPEIRHRAAVIYRFLSSIESDEPEYHDALYMLKAQLQKSPLGIVKLSIFCYKHQEHLFYSPTPKNLMNSLRALCFPVFCSIYFRHLSKHWRKEA